MIPVAVTGDSITQIFAGFIYYSIRFSQPGFRGG